MYHNDFSNRITLSLKNGRSIELDQRGVQIRENERGLMALSYLAPVFEIMGLENFFDGVLTSEMLKMDIGDTGEFTVRFRGMVDGKGKVLPQNLDHKIILLQEPTCTDPRVDFPVKGFSRFRFRGESLD